MMMVMMSCAANFIIMVVAILNGAVVVGADIVAVLLCLQYEND